MQEVSVYRKDRRVVVSSRIEYKDALASVPTREWDPRNAVWRYYASPFVVRDLVTKLNRRAEELGDRVVLDDCVRHLLAAAVEVREIIPGYANQVIVRAPGSRHLPWRHQYIGSRLIRDFAAVYLDWEMGTGKTKATIDAILHLREAGPVRVLIVCPSSVVSVWSGEFAKHVENADRLFEITASRHRTVKKRVKEARRAIDFAERMGKSAIVVTNYESFVLDSSPFLKLAETTPWDLVVADEAHRIATPFSKTTRALTERIGPMSRRRLCLSGTAMRNSPLDLYSQCKFLDPGIFGSNQRQFLDQFAVLDFFGAVVGLQNTDLLSRRFGWVAYHIDKRTVLPDLPPVMHTTRRFDMCEAAMKVYKTFEEELIADFGPVGKVVAANSLVRLLRAQQMTSGYVPTKDDEEGAGRVAEIDSGKLTELSEVLDEIRQDEPVVVFCRFRRDLAAVRALAAEKSRASFELSGSENELAAWQADRGGAVLAVQIKSGGVGVDLTRSCYMVFYSIGFSLADYEQAMARCDRPGQTRPVTAINIVARGTVDEAVFGSIASKKNVVEGVLDYLRGKKS